MLIDCKVHHDVHASMRACAQLYMCAESHTCAESAMLRLHWQAPAACVPHSVVGQCAATHWHIHALLGESHLQRVLR